MAKRKTKNKFHIHPKLAFFLALAILLSAVVIVSAKSTGNGFDQYGYNRTARIFEGKADGVDKSLDGAYWGNTDYANDMLKMKWNEEWDRGNREGWSNPPYKAHLDNSWNGKAGGSGEVWHYKMVWTGPCGAEGAPVAGGGYCIWGQFAVIHSQGTVANEHFWDAHAISSGFGSY